MFVGAEKFANAALRLSTKVYYRLYFCACILIGSNAYNLNLL